MNNLLEQWRLDDQYQKVYKYDEASKAYVFYNSYFALDIEDSMSEEDKMKIIEDHYLYSEED